MASTTTTSETFRPISKNTEWLLNPKNITLGKEIGRGTFGVVYLGNLNNMDVAIKKLLLRPHLKK
jgi:predicted Ser/Thr protein kinase